MEKMLLIDGNSLLHRAYHALPPLQTSKGVHTNAVYGFLNMLFKILTDEKPEYIMVAFDRKGPTFRHSEYTEYKATRPKTPDELIQQFDILKQILKALNIKIVEVEGFEADDILGTISKKGEEKGFFCLIVTGDKDALQLVSKKTSVMLTRKGISEMELYDQDKVVKRYGIMPELLCEMKGLMGDKSDNIPGVPGIGEKTAVKLIKEYKTVENLLKNTDKLKGKLRENLDKYAEQARLSRHLAVIVRDISLDFNPDEMAYRKPDYEKLRQLFTELEFYSMLDRIFPKDNRKSEPPQAVFIDDASSMESLEARIKKSKDIAVLADAVKKDLTSYDIRGIYLWSGNKTYFISSNSLKQNAILQSLKNVLEDEDIYKITHDGKLMRNFFRQLNIDFNYQFDTMLAAYLLDPSKSRYDVSSLVVEFLGISDGALTDCEKQVSYLKELETAMNDKIKKSKMDKLLYDVEIPLSQVLADMEQTGIKVDINKLQELSKIFGEKLSKITKDIYRIAGMEFNINSPKQLGEVLFEKLSLPVIKKTKTGYSTDAEVLEKLKPAHPIVESILNYRFLMKMKSTYIEGLLALVDKKTSRIYTSFNQTVTSTGRISSTEPNLQNIPVKTEEGRHIRGVFTADGPGHVLLSGDYSQIELRVLAHISRDQGLIDAFIKGEDIHTLTASEVFGVLPEDVTPELRNKAKAVNFGIVYGISDYGLAQGLGISNREAQEYINAYFERYPGVREYIKETIKSAKISGYVTTLLNRRRYIQNINSRNYHLRSFAERTAINTPIQGSAADIIKVAMVRIYNHFKKNNIKAKILLQVHDELILDVPENELSTVKEILKYHMEKAIPLKVPLVVNFKQGYTWEQL